MNQEYIKGDKCYYKNKPKAMGRKQDHLLIEKITKG